MNDKSSANFIVNKLLLWFVLVPLVLCLIYFGLGAVRQFNAADDANVRAAQAARVNLELQQLDAAAKQEAQREKGKPPAEAARMHDEWIKQQVADDEATLPKAH